MSNLPGQGRPPKPAALKILEGNRGRRPINEGPKFRPVAPECPEWLTEDAREEWGRLAPTLERMGLLTEADKSDFAAYCQSFARWKQAELRVSHAGITYEKRKIEMSEDGNTFESVTILMHPAVRVAQAEKVAMMRFGGLFGLSPSDRGKINVAEPTREDALERMIE